MTAAELAEVMKGLRRLEARLDRLEKAVWEAPTKERVRVDGVVKAVVDRLMEEREPQETAGDEVAVQRGRRPRK